MGVVFPVSSELMSQSDIHLIVLFSSSPVSRSSDLDNSASCSRVLVDISFFGVVSLVSEPHAASGTVSTIASRQCRVILALFFINVLLSYTSSQQNDANFV